MLRGVFWDSDTAECVLFLLPTTFSSPWFGASLFCLDFREHFGLAFSFLLCRFVLVPASVYICAAFWDRLVVACSDFVVFVAWSVCIFSVWHLPNPHLFSLLDSSSWVGVPVPTTGMILQWAYLHSLLLCFSFSRLLWAFPIPLSWTIQFPLRMCPQ